MHDEEVRLAGGSVVLSDPEADERVGREEDVRPVERLSDGLLGPRPEPQARPLVHERAPRAPHRLVDVEIEAVRQGSDRLQRRRVARELQNLQRHALRMHPLDQPHVVRAEITEQVVDVVHGAAKRRARACSPLTTPLRR
jgi:hypothetical protein